jgi:chemotaxis protein MotB
MSIRSRRSAQHEVNVWPGWVDALSSLIMVIIFVLMIFMVAQFYLAHALSGRDQALAQLNQKVAELGALLTGERQASLAAQAKLASELSTLHDERDRLAGSLAAATRRGDQAVTEAGRVSQALEDANKVVAADREKIELQLRDIASLQADLAALRETRDRLEGQIAGLAVVAQQLQQKTGDLTGQLEAAGAGNAKRDEALRLSEEQRKLLMDQLGVLRDRSKELETKLADQTERTQLAQKEIDQRDIRLKDLMTTVESTQAALTGERQVTGQSRQQIAALTAQIDALRAQLAQLAAALDASQAKNTGQQANIDELTSRLNAALANKVEELARYRSEFFGRLREAIGNRPDIRVVGDRFVFQSEVLFPTGSATLQEAGKAQLAQLARTLLDIARTIPPDVNWILRVDGHTDPRRIATSQFRSNWELSTSRAISVVKFLVEQGIPSERLAATGFGEFQPLESGTTEDAYSRNRRIELKLDQR